MRRITSERLAGAREGGKRDSEIVHEYGAEKEDETAEQSSGFMTHPER